VAAGIGRPGTQKAGNMQRHARYLIPLALSVVLATAGCGSSGSSGTGGDKAASGKACAPVVGDKLVLLEDDKHLQTVDNVIPAVNAAASTPALIDSLNAVSAKLTTKDLTGLISAVNNERKSAVDAASAYVKDKGLDKGVSGGSGAVLVGAADFPESQILANVYADVLNAAGFKATVQSVGKREVYIPALERGEIQVFPEYVGTLSTFLKGDPSVASSDLQKTVDNLTSLGQGVGLAFGEPSPAADQNAFAVTKKLADQLKVKTLSELADACKDGSLVLGGPPECPTRPFCQAGLEDKYGMTFADVQDLDIGTPTNQALQQGKVSIGLVLSTDPILAQ
jgi:osmoprotectant transport system substrate-binding protein